ncbi:MAG: PAS domain-containing sensor histidine kinase [Planctomycetota bacterium]|jgi:PAS domain S-box-containing protein
MSAKQDAAKRKPLMKDHHLLATVLHDSNDAITVQDFEGNIIFWNIGAKRMYGYTKAEALKMNVRKLAPKNGRKGALALLKRLRKGEKIRSFEAERLTKDGRVIDVWITITTLRDEAGNLVAVATTERDITERKHLERELLTLREREQKLIGREMHDSMGQMLTGIAVKSKGLELKLKSKSLRESADAAYICELAGEAIAQTRRLARMLYPVDIEAGGLISALQGLASSTEDLFGISCRFKCNNVAPIRDPVTAQHLYRIAQEAITNASRHGKAKKVRIGLTSAKSKTILKVVSDGKNFPKSPAKKNGIGLKIMEYRANMIGGVLDIGRGRKGGTIVMCTFPNME